MSEQQQRAIPGESSVFDAIVVGAGFSGLYFGFQEPLDGTAALEVSPEEREHGYESRWQRGGSMFMGSFSDLLVNKDANDTAAAFVRSKIREIVKDPRVAETLTLQDFPLGSKRIIP